MNELFLHGKKRRKKRDENEMEEDAELRETVESILGPGIRLLDVEKTTSVKSEEVLLINGRAVPLVGPEGEVIRTALMAGQVPPSEMLNALLISAGILAGPVRLETELTVKQTTLNRDAIQVSRNGCVVDERFKETREEDLLRKTSTEIWRAVDPPPTSGSDPSSSPTDSLPIFIRTAADPPPAPPTTEEVEEEPSTPPLPSHGTVRHHPFYDASLFDLCVTSTDRRLFGPPPKIYDLPLSPFFFFSFLLHLMRFTPIG